MGTGLAKWVRVTDSSSNSTGYVTQLPPQQNRHIAVGGAALLLIALGAALARWSRRSVGRFTRKADEPNIVKSAPLV